MTQRQEIFCLEYAKSGNATQSYLKAGYKPQKQHAAESAAARLLRNVEVESRIKELAKEMTSERIMDATEIQEFLTKIIRGEVTDFYTLKDGTTIETPLTVAMRLKAADQLARIQGLYINRHEMDIDATPIILIDNVGR